MSTRPIARNAKPAARAVAISPASDLISIGDFGPAGVHAALDLAAMVKARPANYRDALSGKQVVLIFEKPSLRTRLTFEVATSSMGGAPFFFDQRSDRLGAREPICDVARNLERWVDGIVLRTFEHSTVAEMAQWASIPVVNGLSDREHPCQALADYFTLQEKFGDLRKVKVAYVGDGNNMAHSLLLTAACTGSAIAMATPAAHAPDADIVSQAKVLAEKTGAKIALTSDPVAAVCDADAVYTDVWASMGQEHETTARKAVLAPYQVSEQLMAHAKPNAIFMHCLPAHRGDEMTDAVIESSRSVVFDQAENRLHIQKAILLMLLGGGKFRHPARSSYA